MENSIKSTIDASAGYAGTGLLAVALPQRACTLLAETSIAEKTSFSFLKSVSNSKGYSNILKAAAPLGLGLSLWNAYSTWDRIQSGSDSAYDYLTLVSSVLGAGATVASMSGAVPVAAVLGGLSLTCDLVVVGTILVNPQGGKVPYADALFQLGLTLAFGLEPQHYKAIGQKFTVHSQKLHLSEIPRHVLDLPVSHLHENGLIQQQGSFFVIPGSTESVTVPVIDSPNGIKRAFLAAHTHPRDLIASPDDWLHVLQTPSDKHYIKSQNKLTEAYAELSVRRDENGKWIPQYRSTHPNRNQYLKSLDTFAEALQRHQSGEVAKRAAAYSDRDDRCVQIQKVDLSGPPTEIKNRIALLRKHYSQTARAINLTFKDQSVVQIMWDPDDGYRITNFLNEKIRVTARKLRPSEYQGTHDNDNVLLLHTYSLGFDKSLDQVADLVTLDTTLGKFTIDCDCSNYSLIEPNPNLLKITRLSPVKPAVPHPVAPKVSHEPLTAKSIWGNLRLNSDIQLRAVTITKQSPKIGDQDLSDLALGEISMLAVNVEGQTLGYLVHHDGGYYFQSLNRFVVELSSRECPPSGDFIPASGPLVVYEKSILGKKNPNPAYSIDLAIERASQMTAIKRVILFPMQEGMNDTTLKGNIHDALNLNDGVQFKEWIVRMKTWRDLRQGQIEPELRIVHDEMYRVLSDPQASLEIRGRASLFFDQFGIYYQHVWVKQAQGLLAADQYNAQQVIQAGAVTVRGKYI